MAIKIYTDRIEIGNYILTDGNNGLLFTGIAAADFVDQGPSAGTVAAFVYGGYGGGGLVNTINRFTFISEVPTASVSTLDIAKTVAAAMQSQSDGYAYGGQGSPPTSPNWKNILRHPFASAYPATVIGSDPASPINTYNSSYYSTASSGYNTTVTPVPTVAMNKFNFASTTPITVSTVVAAPISPSSRATVGGGISSTHGYRTGAYISNIIQKFPFATETAYITLVGVLTQGRADGAACSSTVSAYTAGGDATPITTNTIDKFPFASDSNATDVGDLAGPKSQTGGMSSTTHGYVPAPLGGSTFSKFPFASDSSASDLTGGFARQHMTGSVD